MSKPEITGKAILPLAQIDAAIFDMDGVITQTATVHANAWKRMFDEYRREREARGEPSFAPFDVDVDYRLYVDGRPRYDGVAAFLSARGIVIPYGDPADSPQTETICGLGNRKNIYFLEAIHRDGVDPFESTVSFIRQLRAAGIKTGVFSASKHAEAVLRAAGVIDLFDQKVDGLDADALGLPGKPDPAILVELTRRLGTVPERAVVFEDAIAGVEAGRAGNFRLVVGINRSAPTGALVQYGTDLEVADLSEVSIDRKDD